MSDQLEPPANNEQQGTYHIQVKEHLSDDWQDWFDGMTISHDADEATILTGYIVDQAQLFGLLKKIRNLGLTLISVTRTEEDNQ